MGNSAQEAKADEYMKNTTVNHLVLLDPTGVHIGASRFHRCACIKEWKGSGVRLQTSRQELNAL
jgi:hypothetical protein